MKTQHTKGFMLRMCVSYNLPINISSDFHHPANIYYHT